MYLLLVIVLVLLLIGGIPAAPWGTWHNYGWSMPSVVLVLVIVLVVLMLSGRL